MKLHDVDQTTCTVELLFDRTKYENGTVTLSIGRGTGTQVSTAGPKITQLTCVLDLNESCVGIIRDQYDLDVLAMMKEHHEDYKTEENDEGGYYAVTHDGDLTSVELDLSLWISPTVHGSAKSNEVFLAANLFAALSNCDGIEKALSRQAKALCDVVARSVAERSHATAV